MTANIPDPVRIAVFGAGAMSRALAPRWMGHGRQLTVSGRTVAKVERLVAELGVGAEMASWRDAAERADVVLLAVHWAGVDGALTEAGADDGTLAGKVVVDCGNPVELERFTVVEAGRSLTQRVHDRTGAHLVKAFNLCHAKVWEHPPGYGGRALRVPIAGDPVAKQVVARLVTELGAEPLDVGGLEHTPYLEAMAAVVIRLLFNGADPTTTFNIVQDRPIG